MTSSNGLAAATQVSFHTRAEDLLGALKGVTAVSIDRLEDRRVIELRVVSTDEMNRRQVERNLVSALMAGFGIEVEVGAIRFVTAIERPAAGPASQSVPVVASQAKMVKGRATPRMLTAGVPQRVTTSRIATPVTPIDARARVADIDAPTEAAPTSSPVFSVVGVQLTELGADRFRYTVMLEANGRRCIGEVEGSGSEMSRIESAARATVEASRSILSGRTWYVLDGVRLVEMMGRNYVLSAVRSSDSDARVTSAAVAVDTTVEDASAAATVAALNS